MKGNGRTARRRGAVALLAAGMLVGTMLVATPAGAHFQANIAHIAKHMQKVFYTKKQSDARYVKGQSFLIKLQGGQQRLIARHGAISLVAQCHANVGGNDRVRIVAATTTDGAAMAGQNSYTGASGNTLDTSTAVDARVFRSASVATNSTSVSRTVDSGFVMAPDGKTLTIDAETNALGLNYAGARCVLAGFVTKHG
jgi:hypothetical protein